MIIIDEKLVDEYYKKFHNAAHYEDEEVIMMKMKKEHVRNVARMLKLLKEYMKGDVKG